MPSIFFEPSPSLTTEVVAELRVLGQSVDAPDWEHRSPASIAIVGEPDAQGRYSPVRPLAADSYDRIILGRGFPTFAGNWTHNLLAHLNVALADGGELWVPGLSASEAASRGYYCSRDIEQLWGLARPAKQQGPYLVLPKTAALAAAPLSALGWFYQNHKQMLEDFMRVRYWNEPQPLDAWARQHAADHLIFSDESFSIRIAEKQAQAWLVDRTKANESHLASFDFAISYQLFGLQAKSAIFSKIFAECLPPSQTPLDWLDIGGGSGLLPIELTLQGLPLRRAEVVDIDLQLLLLSQALHRDYAEELSAFRSRWASALNHQELPESLDVVSFVGILLYLPRNELQPLLERVMRSLRPGGLLIVHENIQMPRYTTDHQIMFTEPELETLLRDTGCKMRYFLGTSTREVAHHQVGNKTAFRVLTKPGAKRPGLLARLLPHFNARTHDRHSANR